MNVPIVLRRARRRAGLTQRALAARTGIAQPTIARIERGIEEPRVGTLQRLLAGCGQRLEPVDNAGIGVDRTTFPDQLRLTPAERAHNAITEARTLEQIPIGLAWKSTRGA